MTSVPTFAHVRLDGWTNFSGASALPHAVNIRLLLTLGLTEHPVTYVADADGTLLPCTSGPSSLASVLTATQRLYGNHPAAPEALKDFTDEFERLARLAYDVSLTRVGARPSPLRFFTDRGGKVAPFGAQSLTSFDRIDDLPLLGQWWEVGENYQDSWNSIATFNGGVVPMKPQEVHDYFQGWMR